MVDPKEAQADALITTFIKDLKNIYPELVSTDIESRINAEIQEVLAAVQGEARFENQRHSAPVQSIDSARRKKDKPSET